MLVRGSLFQVMPEELQVRVHGDAALPALIYLPGLHGDWTLIQRFRRALGGAVRFVEFTYPRNTEWSLDDYALAIGEKLADSGISHGWILAESFGSQVAWAMIHRAEQCADAMDLGGKLHTRTFQPEGLILAGGFVSYPGKWQVRFAGWFLRRIGPDRLKGFLGFYARYARLAYRNDPESMRWVGVFIERRTAEDFEVMLHRLRLIQSNEPGFVASRTHIPVYHLFGLVDPVVPGFATRRWLRRHCPGYRSSRVITPADHNVLDRAAGRSSTVVLEWVSGEMRRPG